MPPACVWCRTYWIEPSFTGCNRGITMTTADSRVFARLRSDIDNCDLCREHLPFGPRPVLQAHPSARILIVGQAPGTAVHKQAFHSMTPAAIDCDAGWASTRRSSMTSNTSHWCLWDFAIRVAVMAATYHHGQSALRPGAAHCSVICNTSSSP